MVGSRLMRPDLQKSERLRQRIQELAGTDVGRCYQCGKCTGGCPLVEAMDFTPRQIMRLVNWGAEDEVLRCQTIWVCATCFTCTVRCPRQIKVAEVMEALRSLARREGVRSPARDILRFHRLFLAIVGRFGRLHELSLVMGYKVFTGRLFQDLGLGLQMFLRGKLSPVPERPGGARQLARIVSWWAERERKGGR